MFPALQAPRRISGPYAYLDEANNKVILFLASNRQFPVVAIPWSLEVWASVVGIRRNKLPVHKYSYSCTYTCPLHRSESDSISGNGWTILHHEEFPPEQVQDKRVRDVWQCEVFLFEFHLGVQKDLWRASNAMFVGFNTSLCIICNNIIIYIYTHMNVNFYNSRK